MMIAITPQIKVYLEDLTKLGTFGCSPQEALRHVVNNAIQAMVKDGTLTKREFEVKGGQVHPVP
jgi:hypothetical protein